MTKSKILPRRRSESSSRIPSLRTLKGKECVTPAWEATMETAPWSTSCLCYNIYIPSSNTLNLSIFIYLPGYDSNEEPYDLLADKGEKAPLEIPPAPAIFWHKLHDLCTSVLLSVNPRCSSKCLLAKCFLVFFLSPKPKVQQNIV